METLIINPTKEDYEIRRIYEEIKGSVPLSLEHLPKKYEFEYSGKSLGEGSWGKVFEVEKGITGKVLKWRTMPSNGKETFRKITREYSRQKLAFELGLKVPEPYILTNAYDKTTKANYPLLVMEKIDGDSLDHIFYRSPAFLPELEEQIFMKGCFEKAKDDAMRYLKGSAFRENDIEFHNAIWSKKERDVYLIDCDDWKFKAIENMESWNQ